MNRLWVWLIVLLVPVAILASAVWPGRVAPDAAGSPSSEAAYQPSPRPVGMPLGIAGCTAAACHGAPAEAMLTGGPTDDAWRCAATYWFAADPHTQAYAALETDLARDIMARLRGPVAEATQDVRCLACHTNPSLAKPDTPFAALRAEGVGCESCHGNSSGWLHTHTTWTASQAHQAFAQSGMMKLNDLGDRALVCAGCHIGAPVGFPVKGYPVRDMNHDMIAAGHPRLNFDFADYQRRLPPHWMEDDRNPGFEIKAWLFGRVAHAEAACRLLEDRAARAEANEERTPWPEYAEYQCVSCHHYLGSNYPPPPMGSQRKPGSPAWQAIWPVTDPASFEVVAGKAGDVASPLAALRQALEKPHPRPSQSRKAAAEAASRLAAARGTLKSVPAIPIGDALGGVFGDIAENRIESVDRDLAGQLYHALAARDRWAAQMKQPVQPPEAFESLRNRLQVRRGNLSFTIPVDARADLKELLKGAP